MSFSKIIYGRRLMNIGEIVMGCQSNKLINYIGRGFKGQKTFAKKYI
jgi:hypothetical protein